MGIPAASVLPPIIEDQSVCWLQGHEGKEAVNLHPCTRSELSPGLHPPVLHPVESSLRPHSAGATFLGMLVPWTACWLSSFFSKGGPSHQTGAAPGASAIFLAVPAG